MVNAILFSSLKVNISLFPLINTQNYYCKNDKKGGQLLHHITAKVNSLK